MFSYSFSETTSFSVCVCVCECVRERERESESGRKAEVWSWYLLIRGLQGVGHGGPGVGEVAHSVARLTE